jgi:hypothetical protein
LGFFLCAFRLLSEKYGVWAGADFLTTLLGRFIMAVSLIRLGYFFLLAAGALLADEFL